MKATNRILTGLLLLVPSVVFSQDVLQYKLKHLKLLAEDDRVRVLKFEPKKGDRTPIHSHPATVVYVIQGGRVRVTLADGTVRESEFKSGDTMIRPPVTHSDEALDDMEMVIVELKADGPSATATAFDTANGELMALEKRFAEAVLKGDTQALDRLVSDDWVVYGPDGKAISKAAFLGVIKSGALTHSAMDFDEARVRVNGDTAIVTGRATTTGAYQGQAFTTRERATDVFVRQNGQWKCVQTQLTTIAEK